MLTQAPILREATNDICSAWPNCRCADRSRMINAALDVMVDPTMSPPMPHEVADVKAIALAVLDCIAQRCPDFCYRYVARDQLRLEVFSERGKESIHA
jgi:hypothetical protein